MPNVWFDKCGLVSLEKKAAGVITLIKTAVYDNAPTVVWEVPPERAVLPDFSSINLLIFIYSL